MLRREREGRGLSLRDCSKNLNGKPSFKTLQRYETSQRRIPKRDAIRLSRFFETRTGRAAFVQRCRDEHEQNKTNMDPRRKHWDTYKAKQVFRSHIDIGLGVHFRPESEQVVHTMLTQENSPFDVHDIQYAAAPFAQVVISERKKNGESVMGIGEDGRVWLCVLQNNGKIYTYEGDAKNGLSRPVVPDEKSTVAIDYSNLPRKNFGWGPYADFCRRRKLRYPLTLLELAREEVEQSDLLSEEWY